MSFKKRGFMKNMKLIGDVFLLRVFFKSGLEKYRVFGDSDTLKLFLKNEHNFSEDEFDYLDAEDELEKNGTIFNLRNVPFEAKAF
jgi:hypothetical protein